MRWPFVSRARFDDIADSLRREKDVNDTLGAVVRHERVRHEAEITRYDALLRTIVKLRRIGFEVPPEPVKPVAPADPETTALRRAERVNGAEFKARVVADLRTRGVDEAAAAREAERLLDETFADHPAGG